MGLVYYISHPQVKIDPSTPVPEWDLSSEGRARIYAILQKSWLREISHIFSSDEVKAVATAKIIADENSIDVILLPDSGEIDRASTGYVTHDTHEEIANLCFERPDQSAYGWETAFKAQARIFGAISSALDRTNLDRPIAIIGHGGVGTFLMCELGKLPINRQYDQPGGGCAFAFNWPERKLVFKWQLLEEVSTPTWD